MDLEEKAKEVILSNISPLAEGRAEEELKAELEKAMNVGVTPQFIRFIMSCLSGIPKIGTAIGALGSAWSEQDQNKINQLLISWLKLKELEMDEIGKTMAEVAMRLDLNDKKIEERIKSPEYLSLVRKCFRDWSAAESEEKRKLIRNLLVNAASCNLSNDDVVKLFIDWIEKYTEPHFKVVGTIYRTRGLTRHAIWQKMDGQRYREDSAEADLFKLLIHDLSVGHVIRQHREKDYNGNFVKTPTRRPGSSNRMTSAFDDEKQYELTELGQQFVHYTMNEITTKIGYQSNQ